MTVNYENTDHTGAAHAISDPSKSNFFMFPLDAVLENYQQQQSHSTGAIASQNRNAQGTPTHFTIDDNPTEIKRII